MHCMNVVGRSIAIEMAIANSLCICIATTYTHAYGRGGGQFTYAEMDREVALF